MKMKIFTIKKFQFHIGMINPSLIFLYIKESFILFQFHIGMINPVSKKS